MNVADLAEQHPDEMGHTILLLYGRKAPDYAVYRTEQRVAVQYADDRGVAAEQRKTLAPLNPLRGEINGWIDGWRRGRQARRDRAARYDRRVADALVLAFEGDPPSAEGLLAGVKQDILDERVAFARFLYLITALAAAVAVILAALVLPDFRNVPSALTLWHGAGAGAMGAFFSIAVALHGRTVLPDLQWLANSLDAALRVAIGAIAGAVVVGLTTAHAVTLTLGGADVSGSGGSRWLYVLMVGFIAGFSERMVQDLLGKAEVRAAPPAKPQKPHPKDTTAESAAVPATPSAAPAVARHDPHPEEAGLDHCLEPLTLTPAEITRDEDLPPAAGGVAAAH